MKNLKMIAILMTFAIFSMGFTGCGKSDIVAENTETIDTAENIAGSSEEQIPEPETETTEDVEAEPETEAAEDVEAEPESVNYTFTDKNETMYAQYSVNEISEENVQVAAAADTEQITAPAENAQITTPTENAQITVSAETARVTAPTEMQPATTGSDGLVYFDINDPTTWEAPHEGMIFDADVGAWMDIQENGIDRRAAEEVWSYMNAERAEAGLNTIAWDEEIYNFACQRAQAIIADFSHNGCGNYSENIEKGTMGAKPNGYNIHSVWHYSQGHYNNYMNSRHTKGACAVFVYDGMYYAVEEFTNDSGYGTGGNTTRVINGQTYDVSSAEAAAVDNGNYWIASNGLVVFILGEGSYSCHSGVDEALAAIDEYEACH